MVCVELWCSQSIDRCGLSAIDAKQPPIPPYPGAVLLASPDPDHELVWGELDTGGLAVIDGQFLVDQPIVSCSAGRQARIPISIGTNAREAALWQQTGDDAFADETQYRQSLAQTFGSDTERVAEQYSAAKYGSLSEASVALVTDMAFVCGTRTLARTASRHADVYVYDWQRPFDLVQFEGLGATHSVELAWVWDWWTSIIGGPQDEIDRAAQVVDYWTGLADRGNPNHDGAPSWPKYVEGVDPELAFGDQPTVVEGRRDARCELWDEEFAKLWGDDWAQP